MASWVVRSRRRLSYESMFVNQALQLSESKTTTTGPAVYPHALAIRLAKRGVIESDGVEPMDEQRRFSSESVLEDEVKVESSSFV